MEKLSSAKTVKIEEHWSAAIEGEYESSAPAATEARSIVAC
jgi:hypothetical protein